MFTLEERWQFIKKAFSNEPKIKVVTYQGTNSGISAKKLMHSLFYEVEETQLF